MGDPSLSLGPLLALDIPATSGPTKPHEHEPENAVQPSLQMVPYVPPGSGQVSPGVANHNKHPLFNLLSNKPNNHRLLLPSSIPRHVLVGEAGPSRGVGSGGQELQRPVSPPRHPRVPPRPRTNNGNEWIIVPAERFNQQEEKTQALEAKVKSHKRERVLIYDAAMKQAKKKEEEGVNEAKHTFEREQGDMRREVDLELSKISDLYQERCRDYATMVADEIEGEVNRDAAELRKDWARQKKTIEQLVRGDGEDRQVSVIARAVMEQFQEERKDEIAAVRADIYSDVKMEFESREVALRNALESDFQADLDGQLLLAEIRHQKEMDALRLELGRGEAPLAEAAAGAIVVYNAEFPQCEEKGEGASSASPSARSPSLSRRPLQRRMGSGAGGNRGRKFPVFKTPVQKASPDVGRENARSPAATIKPSIRTKKVSRALEATAQEDDLKSTPVRKQEGQHDGDLTSALMVSPTKAIGVVTPLIDSDGRGPGDGESSRPKKRAKRLFSTM